MLILLTRSMILIKPGSVLPPVSGLLHGTGLVRPLPEAA